MTLHYHRLYEILSLEANLKLNSVDRSHLHMHIHTPRLITKPKPNLF